MPSASHPKKKNALAALARCYKWSYSLENGLGSMPQTISRVYRNCRNWSKKRLSRHLSTHTLSALSSMMSLRQKLDKLHETTAKCQTIAQLSVEQAVVEVGKTAEACVASEVVLFAD